MKGDLLFLFLVLWPVSGAMISFMIGLKHKYLLSYLAIIITFIEFVVILFAGSSVMSGDTMHFYAKDICGMGISFALDEFRYLYGILTGFAFFIASIFSKDYLKDEAKLNRYYFFTLITLAASVGIFLSNDLFTTFIFFEIMSFTSYVWVAHGETKKTERASETYLFVAIICGLMMLLGLFLLYANTGTLQIEELRYVVRDMKNQTVLFISGLLILSGFGAKAGMYPLHIWLPNAYEEAPAPASALLSSILSKTGVFGVIIVSSNLFFGDANWGMIILLLGLITMTWGAILAVFSMNLKRVIAFSSMSQIGFIFIGIGMQCFLAEHNQLAVRGTFLHMVNHSLIKLILFLAVGAVFVKLNTYDLNEVRGFGRKKPVFMFSFFMGALGVMGVSLWNGYVSNTFLHESILEYQSICVHQPLESFFFIVEWMFLISGGLTVAYMLKIIIALFFEKNKEQERMDTDTKDYMKFSSKLVLLLTSIILPLLGVTPNISMDFLANSSKDFMHSHFLEHSVSYFSMENLKGAMISISIGVVVYVVLIRKVLMRKREDGSLYYTEVWPKWLNLEEAIYRPLFTKVLPFLFAVISRMLDKFVDGIALLLSKTILRPARVRRPVQYCSRSTYVFGSILDDFINVLNRTILKKKPVKISFIDLFTVGRTEMNRTSSLVTRSVSFGLLLVCLGLLFTLIYLLIV